MSRDRSLDRGAAKRALASEFQIADTIQNLIDSLPAHIAVIDTDYTIFFVNQAWCAYCDLFNFALPDFGVGESYFDVGLRYGSVDRAKASDMAAEIDLVARGEQPQIVRTYGASLSDGNHYFMLAISPLEQDGIRLLVLSHTDVTPAVAIAEAHRDLAVSLLTAQLDERRRLARELHDATAQTIAAIGVGHANLRSTHSDEGRQSILAELDALVSDASRHIRLLSYSLHSAELEKAGLRAALGDYVEGLAHRTGLRISFDWQVEESARIAPYEAALLRIAQEGLWNVYQHSGADAATVAIAENHGAVSLIISDSGNRIDLSKPHAGLGLQSMRSRAEELGGSLVIDGTERGTRVVARFPPVARPASKSQAPGVVRTAVARTSIESALVQFAERRSTAAGADTRNAKDRSRRLFAAAAAKNQDGPS